ncbi:MAG: 2-iminobutanoate/2-iminopropanoate deaminase [Actinomycetota bacterium]|jgi:2-iminobutanoate/2-iminopropanoate deaminase
MAKPLGPYSPIVRSGDWLVVSGQLGVKDGALVGTDAATQTTQVVANLKSVLESEGASLDHVVKTTVFLTNMDDFAAMNEAYVAGFADHRPARSTIGVAALPLAGAVVEIEAWARIA